MLLIVNAETVRGLWRNFQTGKLTLGEVEAFLDAPYENATDVRETWQQSRARVQWKENVLRAIHTGYGYATFWWYTAEDKRAEDFDTVKKDLKELGYAVSSAGSDCGNAVIFF